MDVALSCAKPRFSCFPLALKYKQTIILIVKTELIQREQIWYSFTVLLCMLSPGQWRGGGLCALQKTRCPWDPVWGLLLWSVLDLPWMHPPFRSRVVPGIACASQSFCMCFGLLTFAWKSSRSRLATFDAWLGRLCRPGNVCATQLICEASRCSPSCFSPSNFTSLGSSGVRPEETWVTWPAIKPSCYWPTDSKVITVCTPISSSWPARASLAHLNSPGEGRWREGCMGKGANSNVILGLGQEEKLTTPWGCTVVGTEDVVMVWVIDALSESQVYQTEKL